MPSQERIIPPINTFLLDIPIPPEGFERIFQERNDYNDYLDRPNFLADKLRKSNKEISDKLNNLIKDMNDLKNNLKMVKESKKTLDESHSLSSK